MECLQLTSLVLGPSTYSGSCYRNETELRNEFLRSSNWWYWGLPGWQCAIWEKVLEGILSGKPILQLSISRKDCMWAYFETEAIRTAFSFGWSMLPGVNGLHKDEWRSGMQWILLEGHREAMSTVSVSIKQKVKCLPRPRNEPIYY